MHDFIAIGDVIVDDFIRLEDERFVVRDTERGSELTMPFREKLPFIESTVVYGVGNAPNAAVSAATLGLSSALVASVGNDYHGERTLTALKEKRVDTVFIDKQEGKDTNYSYMLWVDDDRTILRRHENFSYSLPVLGEPKWIYFSSVGKEVGGFRDDLATYLENNPGIKFAFQPGTNEINMGVEKLPRLYKRADIYFSNMEEAGKVLGIETLGIRELLKRMHDAGPKIVVITDGPRGAYAYDPEKKQASNGASGEQMIFQPPYPDPKPPVERTGAGDSFSSTVAVALSLGHDLKTALKWGSINSMSVVQHVGAHAGLLKVEQIEDYLAKAPAQFESKVLE